jgi:hypothetical protein
MPAMLEKVYEVLKAICAHLKSDLPEHVVLLLWKLALFGMQIEMTDVKQNVFFLLIKLLSEYSDLLIPRIDDKTIK